MASYKRFIAMILTAVLVMYGLSYANTYELEHIFFSQTRIYMAILMGAAMAAIMLAFMLGMYRNRTANILIFITSVIIFALAVYLVRTQITVDDAAYMKAMIPHHSIAILTSERAQIKDPRVRELADGIIKTQRREIAEMKDLIRDIENGE